MAQDQSFSLGLSPAKNKKKKKDHHNLIIFASYVLKGTESWIWLIQKKKEDKNSSAVWLHLVTVYSTM